ncbi:hypothetical protein ABZ883_04610 [Streptomyces sp. NPDC046977]|uniref:hypothetical protein n=1 Tax=Streptomyces sp. NPDC046977 TaxID=3154703 RepID=UPI0033F44D6F
MTATSHGSHGTAVVTFASGPVVELAGIETVELPADYYGWTHHELHGWLTAHDPDRCPSGTDQIFTAALNGRHEPALNETNVEVSKKRMPDGPYSGFHMIIRWRGAHHPEHDQSTAAGDGTAVVVAGPGIGALEVSAAAPSAPTTLPPCSCASRDARHLLELNGSEPVLRHAACGGEVDTAWPSGDTLYMAPIPVTVDVVQEPEDSHLALTPGFPPADEHPEVRVFDQFAREIEQWGHDATPAAIAVAARQAIQPVIDALRVEAAKPLGIRLLERLDAAAEEAAEDLRPDACACPKAEGSEHTLTIDAGSISVIHQACGKPPVDVTSDVWAEGLAMGPLPVTVTWESNCPGKHRQGSCDDDWWPVLTPVPPTTVQAAQVHRMHELAGILVHRREPLEGRALADLITRWLNEVPGASPWARLVDGLNALHEVDMPYHLDPIGVISNPLGPQSVEFDTARDRWVLRLH